MKGEASSYQNLPARLCQSLENVFPAMQHVRLLGLHQADDVAIWRYAHANGLTIVSKDSDFFDLVAMNGAPPRVIWLRIGNCTAADLEAVLRRNSVKLHTFHSDQDASCLILHR